MDIGKGITNALEGDIEKAYDTVDFTILMNILKIKIKDKKLLNIIEQGLKAGIIFEDIKEKKIPH